MTSPNPLVGNAGSTPSTSSSSSSPQSTPSNTLGPDSFITLLTAQLQAQDPLSPMDPDQMVNELTSINSLQQLLQIRTDLDTLVSSVPSASTSGSPTAGSNAIAASNGSFVAAAAKQYSQANSNSQFN